MGKMCILADEKKSNELLYHDYETSICSIVSMFDGKWLLFEREINLTIAVNLRADSQQQQKQQIEIRDSNAMKIFIYLSIVR